MKYVVGRTPFIVNNNHINGEPFSSSMPDVGNLGGILGG
jgi:hypothetical protein